MKNFYNIQPAKSNDETLTKYNMYYLAALRDAKYICENPDNPRSECHAWSSAPVYVFGRFVLGVCEDFDGITISPVVSGLKYAKGRVATRFGTVFVDWKIEQGDFKILVDASECDNELEKTVILPSGEKINFVEKKEEFICEI